MTARKPEAPTLYAVLVASENGKPYVLGGYERRKDADYEKRCYRIRELDWAQAENRSPARIWVQKYVPASAKGKL